MFLGTGGCSGAQGDTDTRAITFISHDTDNLPWVHEKGFPVGFEFNQLHIVLGGWGLLSWGTRWAVYPFLANKKGKNHPSPCIDLRV